MKVFMMTAAISAATLLTACQSGQVQQIAQVGIDTLQTITQDSTAQTLAAYTWSHQPQGSAKPIVLGFANDRIVVNAGCNTMSGAWSLEKGELKVGNMISTMMACSPEIMKQEAFAGKLFGERNTPITLNNANPAQPVLTVKDADGKSYIFTGTATPETKYQGQAETVFLEVAAETKPCTGVAPQQCLQVREIKYAESGVKTSTGDWELFHGQIEGFKHNPKQRTILRLKKFTIKNPAADQSKYAYVHDMTVEQELIK